MLFFKDEYFQNSDYRELNMWATQWNAERSPRDQLLAFRFAEACEKFKVKNALALWCYGTTKTAWFSKAPKDMAGQVKWCEALASEYARLGDIRLMDLTTDELVIMTLVWTQATARLNQYAEFKKPIEPKLPTKIEPTPEIKKNQDPEKKPEPVEPVKQDEKSPEPVQDADKKTMWKRAIGSISGVIALFVDKIPLPLPVKYILKAIFYTIASIFK